jgi:hypothetical protein
MVKSTLWKTLFGKEADKVRNFDFEQHGLSVTASQLLYTNVPEPKGTTGTGTSFFDAEKNISKAGFNIFVFL